MIIDTSPAIALIRWFAGFLHEAPGALAGGFVAYCLHETYHRIWKKPGHWLTRRLRGRGK